MFGVIKSSSQNFAGILELRKYCWSKHGALSKPFGLNEMFIGCGNIHFFEAATITSIDEIYLFGGIASPERKCDTLLEVRPLNDIKGVMPNKHCVQAQKCSVSFKQRVNFLHKVSIFGCCQIIFRFQVKWHKMHDCF